MWVTLRKGLEDVHASPTSLKANKLMNICGTTVYPVQDIWLWMIMLIYRLTSSYDECIEVFLDFYTLSGFDATLKTQQNIQFIASLWNNLNCDIFGILLMLASKKDVWFSFRNDVQYSNHDKLTMLWLSCRHYTQYHDIEYLIRRNETDVITQLGKEYFPLNQPQLINQEKILWFKDFPRPKKIYCDTKTMFSESYTQRYECLGYTHSVSFYEKPVRFRQAKARAIRTKYLFGHF
jgi:hypothetical protein